MSDEMETVSEEVESVEEVETSTEETPEEGSESVEASTTETTPEPEKKPSTKKKLKLKVDGQELEEEFDPEDEEYLVKQLQLAKAAQKAMSERATTKKEYEKMVKDTQSLLASLKENPADILAHLGVDPKEFAVALIEEEIARREKDPRDLENERLKKELESKIKAEEAARTEAEEARLDALRNKYAAEYEKDFEEAIKSVNLPQGNPEVFKRMVNMLNFAVEHGINLSFKEVAPLVAVELLTDIDNLIDNYPDEVVERFLKKERINKLYEKVRPKKKMVSKKVPSLSNIKETGELATKRDENRKIPAKDFWKQYE